MAENITALSDKKNLHIFNVHGQYITHSKQGFESGENPPPGDELRRDAPLQITGDHSVGQHYDKREVDNEDLIKNSLENFRKKKEPKTATERSREFRARQARLKQQKKLNSVVKSTTDDIQNSGSDNQGRIETRDVCESTKKQAKSAAQRMREYRKRKKLKKKVPKTAAERAREYRARKARLKQQKELNSVVKSTTDDISATIAKKILLKQQDSENSDAITCCICASLPQVNLTAQSTINNTASETEGVDSHSQDQEDSESVKRPYMTVIFRKKRWFFTNCE